MFGEFYTEFNEGVERIVLVGRSTETIVAAVQAKGTVTLGDVIGFDYSFEFDGNSHHFAFRHTMVTGDTLGAALEDLNVQMKAEQVINDAIGADIVAHGVVTRFGADWGLFFCQSWPFVADGSPTVTGFVSSGATVELTTVNGPNRLAVNPFIVLAKTTRPQGRPPVAGDLMGGIIWCGDTTDRDCSLFDDAPFYAQIVASVRDPADDQHTATLNVLASAIGLNGEVTADSIDAPNRVRQRTMADAATPKRDFVERRVYQLGYKSIIDWTTIATLIPSATASVYGGAMVDIALASNLPAGAGSLKSSWAISIQNGAPTVSRIGSDVTSGQAPDFRLSVSGSSILLQLKSPNSYQLTAGLAEVTYRLPGSAAAATNITWTIA